MSECDALREAWIDAHVSPSSAYVEDDLRNAFDEGFRLGCEKGETARDEAKKRVSVLMNRLAESTRLRLRDNQLTAEMILQKREAEAERNRALAKLEALEQQLRDARETGGREKNL